ncbi:MAG: hypothetical protein ABI811_14800 [Acidobacteriota bacterium]
MKKTLTVAAFLLSSLVASAETLHVNIPFAFTATGTALPAGEYTISTMKTIMPMLFIEGSGMKTFVFGRIVPVSLTGGATKPALLFEKDALIGITNSAQTIELSSTSSRAKEVIAFTQLRR